MQEINITDEMKADAMKLIEYGIEFRKKYGVRMIDVEIQTVDRYVALYGDNNEKGGFNVYYIYADGHAVKIYIKGKSEEESEEDDFL